MVVSEEFLNRAEAETGFQASVLEKVVRLGEVADDVNRHPLLGAALRLKGGTALNLCWGAPTRLSVDLDYNYVGHLDRDAMLAARPHIEAATEELARRRGYLVQRSPDAFAGRKLFLRYTTASGSPDRIEVDLNFLFRLPVAGSPMRNLWQPGGLDSPRVQVVSLTELCAGKMMALLDRGAPRDAWDANRLPELAGELLTTSEYRACFLALASTLDHHVSTYTRDRLGSRLDERTIRQQLAPMLVAGEAPAAGKLVEMSWSVVAPLLQLSEEEDEFFNRIGQGEFRADLLGNSVAVGLEHHPAIQWKLLNVREHLRRSAAGQPAATRRSKED